MDIETFRQHILHSYFEGSDEIKTYPLNDTDWSAVRQLAEERYRNWEWTYGHSPDFNVEKRERFPSGEIDARLDVKKGIIQTAKFYGDFFSELEPEEVEQKLTGVRYEAQAIRQALEGLPIERYFPGQTLLTFTEFIS
jgi:lipoate-protein ligase A